jgi:membrane protease YdiL (CAAX protease family)
MATIIALAFTALMLFGVPALSLVTARRPDLRCIPRSALYLSAVVSQWTLALLGLVVVFLARPSFAELGFRPVPATSLMLWAGLLTSLSLGGLRLFLWLEEKGWWPAESDLVRLLIPTTTGERWLALLLVAPTAAWCEEFLYRGYLLSELTRLLRLPTWGWLLSSIAFGAAHSYQRWDGMARASVLGALLALPVLRTGSLYPSMLAHFLIDAAALLWLGPKFLPPPSAAGAYGATGETPE